ncbi:hypothetical protein BGZ83_003938 [Gryganskiella cystojenkinii]|nr:hypothetical protein BGZ83_003938 [Gryganskiella cystojenkinii]
MTGNPRRQLCDMHAMLVRHWKRNRRVEPILAENGAKYTHLEIDPIRRDLYLGTHQRELWRYHCSENALETKYQWMRLNGDSSELTSLHLTRDNNIITTYLGGMGRSGTVQIQQGLVDTSWSTEPRSQTLLSFSPKKSNVWTSALSEDKIVLGADQKVILLLDYKRLVQSNCNFIHSDHIQNLWIGSDVFSVAVEPVDRKQNLVYAGCRNGSVRIFDLDQPGTFTSGPDPKEHLPFMREKRARSILEGIGHRDSSTQSLRRVGEHYLVTGAMNGEISMWDKRFVSSRGGSHTTSTTSTVAKSVLDFRTKVQDQFTKIRFDLNVEETLLAAENLNRTVSLWSIKTGERLKDLEVNGAVSSLKFSPDQQGVWVAVGDRVQFWGFGD